MFVERFMHFMNLWTVYKDLLLGRYVPTVGSASDADPFPNINHTLMFALYAYFYSLIEVDSNALNAFRVLRWRFPEEEAAIATVEARVVPFSKDLKVFRNRLGFHGSRSRAHESPGLDLFAKHSGTEILEAMKDFKALVARLLSQDLGTRRGRHHS